MSALTTLVRTCEQIEIRLYDQLLNAEMLANVASDLTRVINHLEDVVANYEQHGEDRQTVRVARLRVSAAQGGLGWLARHARGMDDEDVFEQLDTVLHEVTGTLSLLLGEDESWFPNPRREGIRGET